MVKAKQVVRWEPQYRIPLPVNGVVVCTYVADFMVEFVTLGRVEFHEIKGFETSLWKLKAKLFRACYPEAVLKVIKA
jgi:hypothetical protein